MTAVGLAEAVGEEEMEEEEEEEEEEGGAPQPVAIVSEVRLSCGGGCTLHNSCT